MGPAVLSMAQMLRRVVGTGLDTGDSGVGVNGELVCLRVEAGFSKDHFVMPQQCFGPWQQTRTGQSQGQEYISCIEMMAYLGICASGVNQSP